MTIYLVKGYLDQAATSLADAQALIAALAYPSTAANIATIGRVNDKLETLCQGDTGEPLIISSIDDAAGTISSWVTDASTTLALGLGDTDPAAAFSYASTINFAITGNTRTGTLALNTPALRDAVTGSRGMPPRGLMVPALNRFILHLRKTTAGVTETVGLIPITVKPGVLVNTPADSDTISYVTTTAARSGYVVNLSTVTSLTGGGGTTLDGQDAGSTTFPVGCIVLTSDGNIGRHWKLIGTYLAATDLALGKVKPTNSDATINPVHWQLL
jgi:hypothetical protein